MKASEGKLESGSSPLPTLLQKQGNQQSSNAYVEVFRGDLWRFKRQSKRIEYPLSEEDIKLVKEFKEQFYGWWVVRIYFKLTPRQLIQKSLWIMLFLSFTIFIPMVLLAMIILTIGKSQYGFHGLLFRLIKRKLSYSSLELSRYTVSFSLELSNGAFDGKNATVLLRAELRPLTVSPQSKFSRDFGDAILTDTEFHLSQLDVEPETGDAKKSQEPINPFLTDISLVVEGEYSSSMSNNDLQQVLGTLGKETAGIRGSHKQLSIVSKSGTGLNSSKTVSSNIMDRGQFVESSKFIESPARVSSERDIRKGGVPNGKPLQEEFYGQEPKAEPPIEEVSLEESLSDVPKCNSIGHHMIDDIQDEEAQIGSVCNQAIANCIKGRTIGILQKLSNPFITQILKHYPQKKHEN